MLNGTIGFRDKVKAGKIGGKRRAEILSDERRSEIASYAAKVRWERYYGRGEKNDR